MKISANPETFVQDSLTPRSLPDDRPGPPVADFIATYAAWADVFEIPRSLHEAEAGQMIASILNRNNVIIPLGPLRIPMDVWQIHLTESGVGRNTLIGAARDLLERADFGDILQSSTWGSREGLYQAFAQTRDGLFVFSEFAEFLKRLAEPNFSGAKEWITNLYDELTPPRDITYRETGKRSDTPPIRFQFAPRRNITGASSEAWFFENVVETDTTGGFLARWMIRRPRDEGKVIPVPRQRDPQLFQPLLNSLKLISKVNGTADLSRILDLYDEWYRSARRRFESQPHKALAMAFFNRHRVHILKLAVIYEVSSNITLNVSVASWERAVEEAKELENAIYALLPTAISAEGFAVDKMEEAIRNAASEGMPMSNFTRRFQHIESRERQNRLTTLQSAERVWQFLKSATGRGRRAIVLVHADFAQEYQQRNPGDTPAGDRDGT